MGIKISELESTSTANANDVFVINQNGKTKKITKQILQNQMKNLELEEEIENLEKEVEILSETIDSELEDGVATGESITVNDSARAKAKLDVGGNTEQKQYEGYNKLKTSITTQGTINGITCSYNIDDDSISLNGTCTADNTRIVLDQNIDVVKNNTTFNAYWVNGSCEGAVIFRGHNSNWQNPTTVVLTPLKNTNQKVSKVANVSDTYSRIDIRIDKDAVCSNFRIKLMIAQTTNADYEPYVGGQASPSPDFPQAVQVVKGSNTIKVSNKNWFDKDNAHSINAYINTTTMKFALSSTVKTYWIACQPNTTYTIQKILSKQFRVGTSNEIPSVDSSLLQAFQNNDITQYTITTDSQAKYLCINIRNSSSDTLTEQEILDSIQIEKGSTATDYVEHEEQNLPLTLPEGMEMCKIGDYKDWFVKDLDSGKWYKDEIIEKDVLDGNEVWNKNTGTGYEGVYYSPNKSFVANLGFCDIYSRFNNYNAHDYAFNTNGGAIVIKNKDIKTVEDFKNALKNKNATTYFVRINPQLIEITDTTLISQLDKLYEVITYYGQTNVTCEGDGLSPIFTLNYKKSNRLRLENIENRLAQIEQ